MPYGLRINSCTQLNVIALTFDDGPYAFTSALLDLLDTYSAKVTFFISKFLRLAVRQVKAHDSVAGNNLGKGEIDRCGSPYPAIIRVC